MKNVPREDEINRAYQCADHYYLRGASQAKIAKILGISRPKVSRLLSLARRVGIVSIKLNPPEHFNRFKLADMLVDRFSLSRGFIGIPEADTDDSVMQAISDVFRNELGTILNGKRRIGIGQGRTLYETVKSLSGDLSIENVTVTPLLGGTGHSDPAFQNNTIVDLMAGALAANRLYLMGPTICESVSQRESYASSKSVVAVTQEWEGMDVAIFGLGKRIVESDVLHGALSDIELLERIKRDAEGEILARFFDASGALICRDVEKILLGIPFDLFQAIPERICLAGGKSKVTAIRAALEAGYITTLITDLQTARLILE